MHLLVPPFFARSIDLLLNKSFATDRDCSSFDSASDINARMIKLVMESSRDFAYSLKIYLSFVNDARAVGVINPLNVSVVSILLIL